MRNSLRLAALLAVMTAPASAQLGGSSRTGAHTHTNAAQGGSTITPLTISVSTLTVSRSASLSSATFSGAVIARSSITVGGTAYATAAAYESVIVNGWSVVASTRPTAATSVSFTNLYSTYTYRLHWQYAQVTAAGRLGLRFNSDSGANYKYAEYILHTSGGAANAGSAADTELRLSGNVTPAVSVVTAGNVTIYSLPDAQNPSLTSATVLGQCWSSDSSPTYHAISVIGHWTGGAMNSLQVITSGGAMTGHFWLEVLVTNPR